MIRVAVLPVCVLVVSAAIAVAAEPPIAPAPVKTIRLLCVGNSFSQNATRYLRQIMEAGGYQFVLYNAYIGGCPMEKHWQHIVIHEANADDPAGKPFRNPKTGEKIGLKEALAMEPWDFITIQQASIISHDITTYRPYARNLYDYLKQQVPGAEILMHQTWAYRCDDPRFRDGKMTADSMYEQLTTAYRTIAEELGIRIIPVGDAFQLAAHHPVWGYVPDKTFDPEEAVYPTLPDQSRSLHVGYRWKTNDDGTYQLLMDGHHANNTGEYLGGCVFYEVLTGQSVVGNTFQPEWLTPEDTRLLQTIAHQAVEALKTPAAVKAP